tara:strand:+ start:4713 stop:5486 length:774 start_codon:yes stop_codon:yes gene_type:complete
MECQICFDTISCSEENKENVIKNKEDKCPENISDKTDYFISCNICQNHYHSKCYKLWVSDYKKSPSANKQIKCIMCTNKNCLVKTYFNNCNVSKVDCINSDLVLSDLDLGEEPFTTVDIPHLNTSDILGHLNFVDEIEYLDRYLQNINQNNNLIYESVEEDVDDGDHDDDDDDDDEQSVERRVRLRANGSRSRTNGRSNGSRRRGRGRANGRSNGSRRRGRGRANGRANGSRDQRRIWVHEEYRYRDRNNNGCCVIS